MTAGTGAIAGIDVSFDPCGREELLGELDAPSSSADSIRIRIRRADSIDAPSVRRDAFYGPVSAWCRGPSWTFVGGHTRVDVTGSGVEVLHRTDVPERLALELGTHAALAARGRHHLHAAVLRAPSGEIVLISGPSGAGKSTLSLALRELGWEIGGDDIAYVDDDGRAWPLRRHLRATSRTLALFPHLPSRPAPEEGKMLLDVPRRPMNGRPVILLFPEIVAGERSHSLPIAAIDVVPRLVLGSVFAALPSQERARAALATLATGVPARRLILARDLLEDPRSIACALVETLRS